jgi:hypothetical protein
MEPDRCRLCRGSDIFDTGLRRGMIVRGHIRGQASR